LSRGARRPDPLARLVRRSDRRCILAAAWFVFVAALDLAALRAEDRVFEGATVEPGTVIASYDPGSGDLTVPVNVGGRVVETRELRDAPLPGPGDDVEVEVAVGQPAVIRLTGSSYSPIANAALQFGPLVVCLLLAAGRRRFVRAALQKAGADEPTFALTGVVRAAPLSRRRCQLDLYGLDAAEGDAPLVSVPVATSGEVPLDRPVALACKGVPRPYSLVVARVGDAVLWPSAPAIGARRRPGRPAGLVEPAPLPPADGRAVSIPRLLTRPPVLAAAAGLVLLLGTAGVVAWGAARDRERVATWERAEATVLGPGDASCTVDLRYDTGEATLDATATTGDCAPVASGPGHLVLVDPADPAHVSLLSSRYDPWTPFGWAALTAFVACWWGADGLHQHRRSLAAAAGPWRTVELRGTAAASSVAAPTDAPAVARGHLGGHDGGAGPIAVAGEISPGSTFLADARHDGRVQELHSRSRGRRAAPSW
jgi:hypothetical protein